MRPMNISVILDWLPDRYQIIHRLKDWELSFRHVRILDHAAMTADHHFLYLTEETALPDLEWDTKQPGLVVLCVPAGFGFESKKIPLPEHVILLCTDEPFHKVFSEFQDIFDKYHDWYDRCANMIIENRELSEVLDYAAIFLSNPIALFDPTGKRLHYTGTFQEEIQGTLWEEVIASGFTPTESIAPDEHQRIMQEIQNGSRLIFSTFRQDPAHHSLTAPLFFDGKNFGAFGMTDMNSPFTEAQKALILEIVHLTELAIRRRSQAFLLQEEENYYVIRLLQEYPADELSTAYYLGARNYVNEDTWYLYQFSLPESDASADPRQSAYINQIGRILPRAVILYYEHAIVAVCSVQDFNPAREASYAKLESVLKRLSIHAYISAPFYRFTDLFIAYGQCKLMKAHLPDSQKTIQWFDESFQNILYGILKEKNALPGFCHPAILSLWQSRSEQNRTLIHNLKCYLINGRNIAETARNLHLHRNTFLYRLRKIEEFLHISLDYADENMLLYLLISCFICETFD